MTIHVLIVEDDDAFVEELYEIISSLPGDSDIRVAASRDQAYEMLERDFLDLVILDLKIPTVSGALDADAEHGHAVFNKVRTVIPGVPIFVLTGSPAEDFLSDLVLKNQEQIDVWSEGEKTGTILFLKKIDIDKCLEVLTPVAQAVERLSVVELEAPGLELSLAEDRLMRIFAKRFQGVRCAVSELRGGLSGARVFRLRITDRQGVLLHDAVGKLSTHDGVQLEGECYDLHVTRLAAAATPRKLTTLEYGAHGLAGIFFGLAEGSDATAFDIARGAPESPAVLIRSVEAAMARWTDGVPETRMKIQKIRRRLLSDECLSQVRDSFGLDWIRDFEDREVQTRWACCHGDLHGENIFVSPAGTQLIDYGHVGDGPASLDPVTLELSTLFHPNGPGRGGGWPKREQAKAWGDMDAYLQGCAFPSFVQECRAWAIRASAGSRDIAASAYSYLVRQLKYNDTDSDRVLVLLEGIQSFYNEST